MILKTLKALKQNKLYFITCKNIKKKNIKRKFNVKIKLNSYISKRRNKKVFIVTYL